MEYTSLITSDAFLKLRCDSCKNYLSYFPIYVSDSDKKNICGRCSHVVQEKQVPNEIYEALAQFVKFPCRYKNEGCAENISPQDIPDHERTCNFRTVKCPTRQFTECCWKEALPGCLDHCQDKHSDLMIKDNRFQLDLTESYECTNLLEHDSFLFIVRQWFDSVKNLMKFSICHIDCEVNTNEFPYEVSFKTTKRTVIVQNCTTEFNNEKISEIHLHSLKDESHDTTSVIGDIKFEQCVVHVPAKEVIFEELLMPFTCVTCNQYALPPIFCQSNNSLWGEAPVICSECKEGRKGRFGEINPIEGTRNYGLERIANLLNFPCKHKVNGCTFVSKPPQMQLHLQSCLYGEHSCPLDEFRGCEWKGVGKDIMTHILAVHTDMILNNESIITENILNAEVSNSNSENVCSTTSNSATGSIFAITTAPCSTTSAPIFGGKITKTKTPLFGENVEGKFGFAFSASCDKTQMCSFPLTSTTFDGLFSNTITTSTSTFGAPISSSSGRRTRPIEIKRKIETSTTTTTTGKSNPKCYVIKFSNRLFLLNFAIIGEHFQWTAQMIGPFEDGLMFELEVLDANNKRGSLISKQPCVPLKKNDIFAKRGCYFLREQIASLLSKEIIFKVRLYK